MIINLLYPYLALILLLSCPYLIITLSLLYHYLNITWPNTNKTKHFYFIIAWPNTNKTNPFLKEWHPTKPNSGPPGSLAKPHATPFSHVGCSIRGSKCNLFLYYLCSIRGSKCNLFYVASPIRNTEPRILFIVPNYKHAT